MRIEQVEIYSDATNQAILRHPDRRFPGVLIQGDTLHGMCQGADGACEAARGTLGDEQFAELDALRKHLWGLLLHYKIVLGEHGIPLPFSE